MSRRRGSRSTGFGPGQSRRPRHSVADAAGDDNGRSSSDRPQDLDASGSRARDGACSNQRKLDRTALMLRSESQILISWDRLDAEPTIEGDFALVADSPLSSRVLAFGSWLNPTQAAKVKEATERLLTRGEAFAASVVACAAVISSRRAPGVGQRSDAHSRRLGRAPSIGATARSIRRNGRRSQRAAPGARNRPTCRHGHAMRTGGSSGATGLTPAPSMRPTNRLRSMGAESYSIRRYAAKPAAVKETGAWSRRASAVVGGERRTFDAVEARTRVGSAGVLATCPKSWR